MLKFFWSGRPASFYSWLVVVLIVSGVVGHFARSEYRSYRVEFVLETEQTVNFDIYYDIGRGYNEVDHQSMMVEAGADPALVSFCIPVWNELVKLRFDPAKEHVRMTIHSITLYDDRDTPFAVPLDTLSPKQQIIEHDYDGTRYVFETAIDGEDPIFELETLGPLPAGPRWKNPAQYLSWMLGGLLLMLLGGFVHRFFILGL